MVQWAEFGQKSLDFIHTPVSQDARITILEGSVRSGKTITVLVKLLRVIKEAPKGIGLIAGRSLASVETNILNDLFDTLGQGNYVYKRQQGVLIVMGRKILIRGADNLASETKIRGSTLAFAYVDEATVIPQNFMRMMFTRLSLPGSRAYLTTNPDTPSHYLYTDFITDKAQLDAGSVRVIHYVLDDNPNLDHDYKEAIKREHKGLFYKRFILGEWCMGDGAIFDCLTDENFYEEMPLSAWELERCTYKNSIDVGTQNAQVYLVGIDDGKTLWIEKEYYYSGRESGIQKTHSQYGNDFEEFCKEFENPNGSSRISNTVIDPSAASFKAELKNRGYRLKDADNEVIEGIRWMLSVIGNLKVRINKRRCPNLIRQMQSYRWDSNPTEKGKEQPLKREDDGPDCLRYLIKEVFTKRRLGEL